MINYIQYFIDAMSFRAKNLAIILMFVATFLFCVIGFFDKALAVGLLLLLFLMTITVLLIGKANINDSHIYKVIFMALLVHVGAVLFIYYGNFKPFGGGADYDGYNQIAIEIAHRFGQGNLSLIGLYADHLFPILMGIIYMFTLPSMIVGQLFVAWLAVISILLVYLITIEIGGTKKVAFLASMIISFYPSYLFFGSVLLKDTTVILFVLASILLSIKMIKQFSWTTFFLFFILLICVINLRFYVGYALLFSFILSWPLLSSFSKKRKMIYWVILTFLLGFSSYLVGDGYYGFNNFKKFLNPKEITYYREVVYANPVIVPPPVLPTEVAVKEPANNIVGSNNTAPVVNTTPVNIFENEKVEPVVENMSGEGSTFVLETGFNNGIFSFVKNSIISFIYSSFGPFPWQFRYKRHIMGLAETIPWYILISFFLYSSVAMVKKYGFKLWVMRYRYGLPLLIFGVLAMGALSLFINNYGIIARIRIPMWICFVCIMCLSFDNSEKYEKISHYWRRWLHWI